MEKVFEIYIRTTPARLWEAIIDPDIHAKYNFGADVRSDWAPGSRLEMTAPQVDGVLADGEILVVEPSRRLVHTMTALWDEDVRAEGTSRISWEIEQFADSCRLTVVHSQLSENAEPQLYAGWAMILSGLKTWLETGEVLTTPGSLMYG
jgi:uncharacterized protein YndB with AHSA1/START domain